MANPELIRNTAEIGRRYWLYALLIPVVIIIADQLSKYGVLGLFDLPHDYCAKPYFIETRDLSPLMDFTMKCNRGVSFSMFSSDSQVVRWILTAFAAAMVIVMLVWLRKSDHKLQKLALALVIGGAIGNGIDRVLYGAVIDFIDFSAIKFNYIFNIADSAITCGVIGLLFHAFFIEGKAERAAKKAAKDSSET